MVKDKICEITFEEEGKRDTWMMMPVWKEIERSHLQTEVRHIHAL
jgi:hypothetical protein